MAGDMKDYFDDMKSLKKERKEKRLSDTPKKSMASALIIGHQQINASIAGGCCMALRRIF